MSLNSVNRLFRSKYFIIIFIAIIWISLLLLLNILSTIFQKSLHEVYSPDNNLKCHKINERLSENNKQNEVLMNQNRELGKHLRDLTELKKNNEEVIVSINKELNRLKEENSKLNSCQNPTLNYELSRRRIKQNINELWYYLRDKIDSNATKFVNEIRLSILIDFEIIDKRDNQWREKQLKELSDFVQKRIERLQNPNDCSRAQKLVCDISNCGFGCQMHHSAHCLLSAMALNRTLILKTDNWIMSGINVWEQVFQPISTTCLRSDGYNTTDWSADENIDSYQVINYPIFGYIEPRPQFLPLVIPQQISKQVQQLSGEPFIWFIGQVLKYLMRPSNKMKAFIDHFKSEIGFKHPIVGIHVRRTDKIGTEAEFHSIDEYMHFVNDFYNKIDLSNERNNIKEKVKRRVYLATDEPQVWTTEIKRYRDMGYVFTGDIKHSKRADPSLRNGLDSIQNVIIDLIFLSQSDYLVCTFSSNICRLAFELMQARDSNSDMSNAYYSIDNVYYFAGQVFHGKEAIMSHSGYNSDEISFKVGDVLTIINNMHNGFNFGEHNRTKTSGYYPRFKVSEYIESVPFAIFD